MAPGNHADRRERDSNKRAFGIGDVVRGAVKSRRVRIRCLKNKLLASLAVHAGEQEITGGAIVITLVWLVHCSCSRRVRNRTLSHIFFRRRDFGGRFWYLAFSRFGSLAVCRCGDRSCGAEERFTDTK